MIRLSVNVLTSTIILLQHINDYSFLSSIELCMIPQNTLIDSDDLFSLSCSCKWANMDKDNHPQLTKRGEDITSISKYGEYEQCIRIMLYDYILFVRPLWANRIPYGRKEATIFMTKDEKACFQEADLLSEMPEQNVVEWWDHISSLMRSENDNRKNEIGRQGEVLTLQYEQRRTLTKPEWISFNSNLSGYDIKSIKSRDDNSVLLIEVKTSTENIINACCYISEKEWLTAIASSSYMFYFWSLFSKKLAVISPTEVLPYIPTNNLFGAWTSVKIPFSCFETKFKDME